MPAGGGIIQIAALGRQNDYINKNPNFTLFKTTHNKYTNFAEDFEWQEFNGVITFGSQKSPATISRYGDLITDVHLYVSLPKISAHISTPGGPAGPAFALKPGSAANSTDPDDYYPTAAYWVNAVGYALMQEVTLEIGSQDIDTLYSEYMLLWEDLTQRPGARIRESIGRFDYAEGIEDDMIEFASQPRDLFVQIPFFFNKYFMERGLALPLISLTYHEVKIKVTFAPVNEVACVVKQDGSIAVDPKAWILQEDQTPINDSTGSKLAANDLQAKLLVTFIYLDVDERNTFAQTDQEILVTILQRQVNSVSANPTQESLKLYFNHPSNFLLWVVRPQNFLTNAGRRRYSVGHKDRFDFTQKTANATLPWGDIKDPITNATLRLNSHERWPENMTSRFFRLIQPQLKFENLPTTYLYIFCFSIAGGVWNPTSTLNFSRIEHTQLDLKYNTNLPGSDILLFVESYNLLVVKSGMGKVECYNLIMYGIVLHLHLLMLMKTMYTLLSLHEPVSTQKVGKSVF